MSKEVDNVPLVSGKNEAEVPSKKTDYVFRKFDI